jgi:hypothetical protein
LIKEKKATLIPSTVKLCKLCKLGRKLSIVKLLYQQTKKAQSEKSNRVPEGEKKPQRDWSTSLKQARAPGTETAELSQGSTKDDHPS